MDPKNLWWTPPPNWARSHRALSCGGCKRGPPRAASGAKVAKQGMEVLRTACAYTNSAMPHVIRFTSPATRATGTPASHLAWPIERPAINCQKENPRREPGFSSARGFHPAVPARVMIADVAVMGLTRHREAPPVEEHQRVAISCTSSGGEHNPGNYGSARRLTGCRENHRDPHCEHALPSCFAGPLCRR